jgi:hypothetical protein
MDGVMTAPTRWLPWDEGVVGVSESSGGSPLGILVIFFESVAKFVRPVIRAEIILKTYRAH